MRARWMCLFPWKWNDLLDSIMLELQFPHERHREMYDDMIEEWKNFEETPTSPGLLFKWDDYDSFLQYIRDIKEWRISDRTASSLYFWVDGEKIIWAIDIRHNIDHPDLKNYGGHIGYWIRPNERKKWYATEMLGLGILEAKYLWVNKILIAHHPENIASEKVILKNGWKYFETKTKGDEIYKKYWIC